MVYMCTVIHAFMHVTALWGKDVYKRQVVRYEYDSLNRRTRETRLLSEGLTQRVDSVSYTHLDVYKRQLLESRMPLAIDFGSSNTTAGVYLDSAYFEQLSGDPIAQLLKRCV